MAEEFPVQVGRGDRTATLARRAQPILIQLGDERQQSRVTCQVGEVPHVLDQVQPDCRAPFRLGTAGVRGGKLPGQRACEAVDQEITDLLRCEVLKPDDEPAKYPLDLLPGFPQHLVVSQEELGPARDDDFRSIVERGQQGVQVRDRALVGDPGRELVEAIEDQY